MENDNDIEYFEKIGEFEMAKKPGIVKKTVSGLFAGLVLFVVSKYAYEENFLGDPKSLNSQILLMDNLQNGDESFKGLTTLLSQNDGIIEVFADNSITDSYFKSIGIAIDVFNDAFEKINPQYKFKLIRENPSMIDSFKGCISISLEEKNENKYIAGVCEADYFTIKNGFKGAKVTLYDEYLSTLGETTQTYVVLHELGHAIGLDHVDREVDCFSFMKGGIPSTFGVWGFSPTDLRKLVSMYGDNDKTEYYINFLAWYDMTYITDVAEFGEIKSQIMLQEYESRKEKNNNITYGDILKDPLLLAEINNTYTKKIDLSGFDPNRIIISPEIGL